MYLYLAYVLLHININEWSDKEAKAGPSTILDNFTILPNNIVWIYCVNFYNFQIICFIVWLGNCKNSHILLDTKICLI